MESNVDMRSLQGFQGFVPLDLSGASFEGGVACRSES